MKKIVFSLLLAFTFVLFIQGNNLSASAAINCELCTEDVLCQEHSTNNENEIINKENNSTDETEGDISPNAYGDIIVEDENDEGIFLLGIDNESHFN